MVNYSAIVDIVRGLTTHKGSAPCKKTLQKIVFLIEAKGTDLGCDYGIHFYGPYSADLDYAVRDMCGEGILNIDYIYMQHQISVGDETMDSFEADPSITHAVNEVIDEFSQDSPSELELIATALFVYIQTQQEDEILPGVIKIKGKKYSNVQIIQAIERLKKTKYIVA